MKFSQQVREAADSSWQASFEHPFVKGIAAGNLPLDCFKYYVMQDSYYLSYFMKIQAIGASKAPDMHTSRRFAVHAQGTYEAELALHKNFAIRLGVTEAEKAGFKPAPTAYAYTSHLLRAAHTGHLGDIVAAILPCYWLYYEIGEKLSGAKPEEPIYQEWIAAYGGEWFRELVEEQINRLDEIAEHVSQRERDNMLELFLISSQYEWMFWEMAFRMEQWPVSV